MAGGIIATVALMAESGLPCYGRGAPVANLRARFRLDLSDAQAAQFMRATIDDAYDKVPSLRCPRSDVACVCCLPRCVPHIAWPHAAAPIRNTMQWYAARRKSMQGVCKICGIAAFLHACR